MRKSNLWAATFAILPMSFGCSSGTEATADADLNVVKSGEEVASQASKPVSESETGAQPAKPKVDVGVCFTDTRNAALAGLIPGCACDEETAGETCAEVGDQKLHVFCASGSWSFQPINQETDPEGLIRDLCQRDCKPAQEDVAVSPVLGGAPADTVEGEPACQNGCGYRYDLGLPGNDLYAFDRTLVCPQAESEACAWLAKKLDVEVGCEVDADCSVLTGDLVRYEPHFLELTSYSSVRLSAAEQASRNTLALAYKSAGCGQRYVGFDGPLYKVACVDAVCGFEEKGSAGSAR